MLVLLPPSEAKFAPLRGRPLDTSKLSFSALHETREQMLAALVRLCRDDPEEARRVLGLPAGLTDEVRRNALLPDAATAPAARIYTGVLYDALGLRTLSPAAKRRAASRLLVTSSLYGLVRPSDRVAAYRLSGDVSLPGLGTVASLWRPNLARTLEPLTARNLLVDLRSTTYAAFWRPAPEVASRVVTLHVVHESDGVRQVISHFNKATKGRLVRDLLEDGANPRTPAAFAHALTRLGWTIEATPGGGSGFDVVVHGT